MTISEREEARAKCLECEGTKVTPQLSDFMAQTSKKSRPAPNVPGRGRSREARKGLRSHDPGT